VIPPIDEAAGLPYWRRESDPYYASPTYIPEAGDVPPYPPQEWWYQGADIPEPIEEALGAMEPRDPGIVPDFEGLWPPYHRLVQTDYGWDEARQEYTIPRGEWGYFRLGQMQPQQPSVAGQTLRVDPAELEAGLFTYPMRQQAYEDVRPMLTQWGRQIQERYGVPRAIGPGDFQAAGWYQPDPGIIAIDPRLSREVARDVYAHELGHGVQAAAWGSPYVDQRLDVQEAFMRELLRARGRVDAWPTPEETAFAQEWHAMIGAPGGGMPDLHGYTNQAAGIAPRLWPWYPQYFAQRGESILPPVPLGGGGGGFRDLGEPRRRRYASTARWDRF
jgi:hypothetical protein